MYCTCEVELCMGGRGKDHVSGPKELDMWAARYNADLEPCYRIFQVRDDDSDGDDRPPYWAPITYKEKNKSLSYK